MAQSVERAARDAKIAELKRLITAGKYESQEKLEDAVDAFLWSEQDRLQQEQYESSSTALLSTVSLKTAPLNTAPLSAAPLSTASLSAMARFHPK